MCLLIDKFAFDQLDNTDTKCSSFTFKAVRDFTKVALQLTLCRSPGRTSYRSRLQRAEWNACYSSEIQDFGNSAIVSINHSIHL